jgi:DMSO/TMAO reductase YedYZ molybdopterin-dependent catalytic subunit
VRVGKRLIIVIAVVAFLVLAAFLANFIITEDQSITPNDKFFTVSITDPPVIDPDTWTLKVDGLVDFPMELNYSQITALSNVTEKAELRCVTGPSATAYYTGVTLPDFMRLIGVKGVASEMIFYCADSDGEESYSTSLTLQELDRDDILLAWRMNNATLPENQGFPLKLVVPGDWGYKWAKWIVHISVVDFDYKGYWEKRGWADNALISPISDWTTHAILLSIAAVIGGVSVVSGFRNSKNRELSSMVPWTIPKKYHRYISTGFYVLFLFVFLFWASVTFDNRGAIFYTFHGRIALITIILAFAGIITSIPLLNGSDRWRTIHFVTNVGGYLMLLITIALGVLLALG